MGSITKEQAQAEETERVIKLGSAPRPLDLMIDIETLSNDLEHGLIRQIGWCLFDPHDEVGKTHDSGALWIDVESSLRLGAKINWQTVQWWLKQSDEARALMVSPPPGVTDVPLDQALMRLSSIHNDNVIEHVWAKPPAFDLGILRGGYRMLGLDHPKLWDFKALDLRTVLHLYPSAKNIDLDPYLGVAHNARYDAVIQAAMVQKATLLHGSK